MYCIARLLHAERKKNCIKELIPTQRMLPVVVRIFSPWRQQQIEGDKADITKEWNNIKGYERKRKKTSK